MDKIECSVWNNGGTGWGLKVLGGLQARQLYFRRDLSPISVELDGTLFPFNIDKKSFWTRQCGELIGIALRNWTMKNRLAAGDRVWLEVVKPYHTFRAIPMRATLSTEEIAQ